VLSQGREPFLHVAAISDSTAQRMVPHSVVVWPRTQRTPANAGAGHLKGLGRLLSLSYSLHQQREPKGHVIAPTTDLNRDHTPATLVPRLWTATLLSGVVGAWQKTRVITYPHPVQLPLSEMDSRRRNAWATMSPILEPEVAIPLHESHEFDLKIGRYVGALRRRAGRLTERYRLPGNGSAANESKSPTPPR
jgi:hypothetical protein